MPNRGDRHGYGLLGQDKAEVLKKAKNRRSVALYVKITPPEAIFVARNIFSFHSLNVSQSLREPLLTVCPPQ